MTREQLIKNWDLVVAFKEGKIIECFYWGHRLDNSIWESWVKDDDFVSDFTDSMKYRIRPEEIKE